jgi:hypothetical protein
VSAEPIDRSGPPHEHPLRDAVDAMELATRAADDPARVAAEAHVASCESCRLAWDEALSLSLLLEELPSLSPPEPAVLARVASTVWASPTDSPAADRAESPAILAPIPAEASPVPDALRFPVVAAAVTVGLVSAALGVFAKRKSADPAVFREASFALVIATTAALTSRAGRGWSFAAVLGASAALVIAAGEGIGVLSPAIGAKCLVLELVAAALPFGVLGALVIKRRFPPDRIVYATVAMSGALGGHAMLDLSCPDRTSTFHLAVFHFGGVVLAGVLGWLFAQPITRRALAGISSNNPPVPP